MNKWLSILFIAALAFSSCKQDKKPTNSKDEKAVVMDESLRKQLAAHQYKIYETSLKREDISTAIYALNSFLELDTTKPSLYDSLAMMYMETKNLVACSEIVNHILKSRPNDSATLMLGYIADGNMGNFEGAIQKCAKLYEVTKNILVKAELVKLYLNNNNVSEASTLIEEIIQDPRSQTTRIPNYDQRKNQMTDVNLRAYAYFLKGSLYGQLGQKEKAVAAFRKVLEIEENFEPAALAIRELLYSGK